MYKVDQSVSFKNKMGQMCEGVVTAVKGDELHVSMTMYNGGKWNDKGSNKAGKLVFDLKTGKDRNGFKLVDAEKGVKTRNLALKFNDLADKLDSLDDKTLTNIEKMVDLVLKTKTAFRASNDVRVLESKVRKLAKVVDSLPNTDKAKLAEYLDIMSGSKAVKTASWSSLDIKLMVDAYLEAALWTAADTDDEGDTYELDTEFDVSDFTSQAVQKAKSEVNKFLAKAGDLLSPNVKPDQVGHDIWLSRNGHGAGFFDKPEVYGDNTDELQDIARGMGEQYVYVTDDKELEIM